MPSKELYELVRPSSDELPGISVASLVVTQLSFAVWQKIVRQSPQDVRWAVRIAVQTYLALSTSRSPSGYATRYGENVTGPPGPAR